jgi:hypothetical protein
MDKIINWLLLTIIFVFDPLAIALVIAANFAFEKLRPKTKDNIYGEKVVIKEEEVTEEIIPSPKPPPTPTPVVINQDPPPFHQPANGRR